MKLLKKPQILLIIYGSLMALSALLVLGMMLTSPSEPGNTVLFGLSLIRLIFALGLSGSFVLFIVLTIKAARDKAWAEEKLVGWFGRGRISQVLAWLGGIGFGLGWTGIFLPSYRVGRFENYWLRIQPLMFFILLAGIVTLVLIYTQQKKSRSMDPAASRVIRLCMALFLICLLALTFMLSSGFGVHSRDDFWYGAGVPILLQQLIGAMAGGLLFLLFEKKWGSRRFDIFVFILVFSTTAFLWAREPLQKGFSFISLPPNYVLYPLFDAVNFDLGSQFPLIGQRIFLYGTYFFERPLYPVFLVYLHTQFGQNYEVLMAGQAAVFAIFPALIYLIGRSLNLRTVGFATALVAMFRGINSIAASNMIDLANPKMILTDFPAAIGVALVVLAVCEWLKQPNGKWQYALWVGGAIGFTLMLRTNALMLLALIPAYALFKLSRDWKNWLSHSSLLVLAVIAITLPWELRNQSLGGPMYGQIVAKFKTVIDQRYTAPTEPVDPTSQLPITQSTGVLVALYSGNGAGRVDAACNTVVCFVPNHFLHNIVTSILILPTSPIMDDLRHTVRDNFPYWYPKWDGTFTPSSLFLFVANIFFVVLGVSAAWKQKRLSGLAPLAIFLIYNLSNAFARTSGGRYIVPMDWIISIYFLIGVFQVIVWVAKTLDIQWDTSSEYIEGSTDHNRPSQKETSKAIFALFILLGSGSLLPLSEHLHTERYQNLDARQVLAENKDALETAGLDIQSIDSFLQKENATIILGRALFPRHYGIDEGYTYYYPNLPLGFPRTTFNLIGVNGEQGVILPGDIPQHFPHASDVIVIGCREADHLDGVAVVILDGSNAVYIRSPESELTCPLRQPVCENDSGCK